MSSGPVIAICIGHSRQVRGGPEGGALSCDPVTPEWSHNRRLGMQIARLLEREHFTGALVVDAYQGASYGEAMRWLAGHLRDLGVRLAVELHFNSSGRAEARGHEWLHWHASRKGRLAAMELHLAMCGLQSGIPPRGVKAVAPGGRGAEFLRRTHCPAVICEPFFGTNEQDWAWARRNDGALAAAMAKALAPMPGRFEHP
jgi:N-acetylmuramoyl-L-alanine amidase